MSTSPGEDSADEAGNRISDVLLVRETRKSAALFRARSCYQDALFLFSVPEERGTAKDRGWGPGAHRNREFQESEAGYPGSLLFQYFLRINQTLKI